MNDRAAQSTIGRSPHAFINKNGEPVLITPLNRARTEPLVAMYMDYQPRNSFWGLPPIRDDACREWVDRIVRDGENLVALSFQAGVVGHAALFPMGGEGCEMLVVVAPAHQNLGIGTQLARCSVQLAHEIGFRRIWLSIESNNLRARHVFRKCGFEYVTQDDPTEVEMALDVCGYHDPSDIPVSDLMTREVLTVHKDVPCRVAVETFLQRPIGAMPVLDGSDQVIGIVSQTDLIVPANLDKHVGDIMTRRVITVREDTPVTKVVRLFHVQRLRSIPVVDAKGHLVGIIGRKDILAYYAHRR